LREHGEHDIERGCQNGEGDFSFHTTGPLSVNWVIGW
jgi:hypothetical protein